MCEKLFECQPLLAWMIAGIDAREVCVRGRLMQVQQRIEQCRHIVFFPNIVRQ